MYVTAIVPAHNEAGNIKRAVRALKKQVDKVIVVCDRCDDDTCLLYTSDAADE